MQAPVLIVPPVGDVVTLEEAKQHLRVYYADDDPVITSLLAAAVDKVDGWRGAIGRCLLTQTWQTKYWAWPINCAGIWRQYFLAPFPDIQSVEIRYRDRDDVEQTLDAASYTIDADRIYLKDPLPNIGTEGADKPITIDWTCGYGATGADVPEQIRLAVKMMLAHFYEHREAVSTAQSLQELPLGPRELLKHFKAFT